MQEKETLVRVFEISDSDKVKIRNLMSYPVVIITPMNKRRFELAPHGIMEVRVGDIRECGYDRGCRNIFRDYVQICNEELAKEFGVTPDVVEYNWGEKEIVAALTTADMDVLLDALEYGTAGIKEALLDKAVELEIPDTRRREAISEALGVNVDSMIRNAKLTKTETASATKTGTRRVSAKSTSTTTKRRAASA